jgi:excisionase family DNA binding protein
VEPVSDNYIGIDEVAEYLGVKVSTVRTWIKTKEFPAHKIGGKLWKFKKSEKTNGLIVTKIKNNLIRTRRHRDDKVRNGIQRNRRS